MCYQVARKPTALVEYLEIFSSLQIWCTELELHIALKFYLHWAETDLMKSLLISV